MGTINIPGNAVSGLKAKTDFVIKPVATFTFSAYSAIINLQSLTTDRDYVFYYQTSADTYTLAVCHPKHGFHSLYSTTSFNTGVIRTACAFSNNGSCAIEYNGSIFAFNSVTGTTISINYPASSIHGTNVYKHIAFVDGSDTLVDVYVTNASSTGSIIRFNLANSTSSVLYTGLLAPPNSSTIPTSNGMVSIGSYHYVVTAGAITKYDFNVSATVDCEIFPSKFNSNILYAYASGKYYSINLTTFAVVASITASSLEQLESGKVLIGYDGTISGGRIYERNESSFEAITSYPRKIMNASGTSYYTSAVAILNCYRSGAMIKGYFQNSGYFTIDIYKPAFDVTGYEKV